MFFVKNMLFCSSAISTMAPDVDLFAEVTHIATYFATQHGDRIAADVGIDPRQHDIDLDGMRASMGLADGQQSITMRELEERRRLIRERLSKRRR